MSEFLTAGLQEAEKSTKNEVETVLPDTLYLSFIPDHNKTVRFAC